MRKLVVFLAVIVLMFGLVASPRAYAQIGGIAKHVAKEKAKDAAKDRATKAATKQAKPAKPGKVSGTISSFSDTSLVVSQGSGASKKDETFVMNAQTKKEGNLENGGKVTVQYKAEGSDKVATAVKASAPKAAPKAKEPKKKKG